MLEHVSQPENSRYGFRVADCAAECHPFGARQREKSERDFLVFFRLGGAGLEAARQVDAHRFIQKAGADIEMKYLFPCAGAIARLLEQLALGACELPLTVINPACRQLPQELFSGMAVLTFKENARLVAALVNSEDHHRSGVMHHVAPGANAARLFDLGRVAVVDDVVSTRGLFDLVGDDPEYRASKTYL